MSSAGPGGNGTTSVIGFDGQDCADAGRRGQRRMQ